jgi:hypothetical protein
MQASSDASLPYDLTEEIWIIKHGAMQETQDPDSGKEVISVQHEEDDGDEQT